MQCRYRAAQSLLAMAGDVFTAPHLQHRSITLCREAVVVLTFGKMLSRHVISAITLRPIGI
jgi:hypothetical protein